MSLRARLLGVVLGLLALFSVAVGVSTVLALHEYLTDELDGKLRDLERVASGIDAGGPGPTEGPDAGRRERPPPRIPGAPEDRAPGGVPMFLQGPGAPSGAIGALVSDGEITDAAVVRGYDTRVLGDAQRADLATVPADGEPHTEWVEGQGEYRVINDGSVVVGLPLSEVDATSTRLATLLVGIALLGLIAAAAAGTVLVGRELRPLRRVAGTARRVADRPLDRGEVALAERVPNPDTRTEVGQVGVALNHLLDNVAAALRARQRSEQRVRQFVADASHELRTPLAAIRGYGELSERATDHDVRDALRRVSTQANRMGVLVDDLLLLARLDAGRPLRRGSVDLSLLLLEAVDEARVAGPSHRWLLELPETPVTIVGDEQRLRQVLANLLSNARAHTPPGTTVTTSLETGDERVRVHVTDDGPGIPPDLLPNVFERFARGDDSRSRTAGSSGLGLAIAEAVVAAHDGTVTADSEPGRTVFTVTLPTVSPATPDPSETEAGGGTHSQDTADEQGGHSPPGHRRET